jgi:hypothetical protein
MEIKVVVKEEQILSMPHDETLGRWVRKKFWEMRGQDSYENDVEYDHCVICGKQSPYTRNTPIEERIGYVEGGGQSCFTSHECDKI